MKIAIIGSGPSGVSAAKALISFGYEVDIIDFGNKPDYCSEELSGRIRSNTMSDNDHAKLKNKIESGSFLHNIKNTLNLLTGSKNILDLDKKRRLGSDFTFSRYKRMDPSGRRSCSSFIGMWRSIKYLGGILLPSC